MNDLPPDLPRLRTLETWLAMSLDRVRAQIAAAEQREKERQQGEARRPPPPDWVLEVGIGVGSPPVDVHAGHCYIIGKRHRAISREQALAALAEGVPACIHCRPDTELGVL
ncbi:DUF6233 domain-containing protein [Streptomyces poriferorum]|uniref:DUF6233 domain-containing protein n=1 Tax=Streptomyces poriferorum TaxID=2798799 RepID=A0ABY9J0Q3_9ACTN|nr:MULTISPECIES: DUF6233 domain-containing protein [unclassified Streptomyces]MDP5310356.1 DUF6233 domain-containing protein [Streptomyces sp. Alt4]WLQ60489.1 DUF6233 domain-containing protein [Streptomyces sp. Alt2]